MFEPFLLFGVTGSGKTQVYIEAIRHALGMGKTALVLLPEIALTPFVWGRFYQAFGNRVAIQHSAQSPAVRFDLWREIRAGKYPVVVGARSAVFAPLSNLGLVVVDEEQESQLQAGRACAALSCARRGAGAGADGKRGGGAGERDAVRGDDAPRADGQIPNAAAAGARGRRGDARGEDRVAERNGTHGRGVEAGHRRS